MKQEAEGRGIIDRCCQLHSSRWLLSIALGRGGREEEESGSGGEAVQFRDGPVGLKRLRAPPEPRRGARGAGLGRVLRAGTSEVRRAPRRQALKKQPPRGRSRFGLAWPSPPTCWTERRGHPSEVSLEGGLLVSSLLWALRRKYGVELPGASSPPLSFRGGRRMGRGSVACPPSAARRGRGLLPAGAAKVGARRDEAQVKDRFGHKGAETLSVQNWPQSCSGCGRKVLPARCHPVARGKREKPSQDKGAALGVVGKGKASSFLPDLDRAAVRSQGSRGDRCSVRREYSRIAAFQWKSRKLPLMALSVDLNCWNIHQPSLQSQFQQHWPLLWLEGKDRERSGVALMRRLEVFSPGKRARHTQHC